MYLCKYCGYKGDKELWKPFISSFDNQMEYCTCPGCHVVIDDPVEVGDGVDKVPCRYLCKCCGYEEYEDVWKGFVVSLDNPMFFYICPNCHAVIHHPFKVGDKSTSP